MSIRGIHHAGLVVDDLDAAVSFYSALLDMTVIERDRWRVPAPSQDQASGFRARRTTG